MSCEIQESSNTEAVDKKLKEICLEIEKRYEIKFLEIDTEKEHVHFLVQSIPVYSPASIVQRIKSITARKTFEACPEVKNHYGEGNSGRMDIT
jgi:REP element-mobilizing transposase RayT